MVRQGRVSPEIDDETKDIVREQAADEPDPEDQFGQHKELSISLTIADWLALQAEAARTGRPMRALVVHELRGYLAALRSRARDRDVGQTTSQPSI